MSKVKIITDSGCDISKENEQRYGIDIMSFEITLGDETIIERKTMSNEDFLQKIKTSEFLPKTAQITAIRFEEKFLECAEQGYDDIIVVLINSTGSQTYANAVLAEKNLRDEGKLGNMKVHIIDSRCYSLGYGWPVVEAAKKIELGMSIDMVLAYLADWFNCLEIYIIGFDLRHMKKSGRINAAAAFLGELMGLRPIISLIDGESVVVKKSRGDKNAVADAVNYISGRMIPETPWQVLTSTVSENEDAFIKQYTKKVGSEPSMTECTGGVVASNAGYAFIGVLIKGQPRR